MKYLKFAQAFGQHLGEDDFHALEQLLTENCKYTRGAKSVYGAVDIVAFFKRNDALAAKKLDWGQAGECKVKMLDAHHAEVILTEFIKHNGLRHTYKYKTLLTFDPDGKIRKIEHQDLFGEEAALKDYYRRAGII